jgi:hypothetical protein
MVSLFVGATEDQWQGQRQGQWLQGSGAGAMAQRSIIAIAIYRVGRGRQHN